MAIDRILFREMFGVGEMGQDEEQSNRHHY
jgi:hypothetical protein